MPSFSGLRTSAARTALVGKSLEALLSLDRPKRRPRSGGRGSSLQSSLPSLFDESVKGSLDASKALITAPVNDVANILAELNEVVGFLKSKASNLLDVEQVLLLPRDEETGLGAVHGDTEGGTVDLANLLPTALTELFIEAFSNVDARGRATQALVSRDLQTSIA